MNLINILLSWLVPLMLAWVIFSIFYWCFARRVFHDAIIFRIFRKRDELRAFAIQNVVDPTSFEYKFLEQRLCQTVYSSPDFTIVNFIRFCFSQEAQKPSPDLDKFLEVAPKSLINLWESAMEDLKLMMMVNSPNIAIFGAIVLLVNSINQAITKEINKFFELEFVETELVTVEVRTQPHIVCS